jgi:hypothetical protein
LVELTKLKELNKPGKHNKLKRVFVVRRKSWQ